MSKNLSVTRITIMSLVIGSFGSDAHAWGRRPEGTPAAASAPMVNLNPVFDDDRFSPLPSAEEFRRRCGNENHRRMYVHEFDRFGNPAVRFVNVMERFQQAQFNPEKLVQILAEEYSRRLLADPTLRAMSAGAVTENNLATIVSRRSFLAQGLLRETVAQVQAAGWSNIGLTANGNVLYIDRGDTLRGQGMPYRMRLYFPINGSTLSRPTAVIEAVKHSEQDFWGLAAQIDRNGQTRTYFASDVEETPLIRGMSPVISSEIFQVSEQAFLDSVRAYETNTRQYTISTAKALVACFSPAPPLSVVQGISSVGAP